MLELFAKLVPQDLHNRSGNVFYAGRAAFSNPSPVYVLGYNPGGDASVMKDDTIGQELRNSLDRAEENFSQYRDASWNGFPAGTYRMQPRVLHLMGKLQLDPGLTPSSNLIFVRSRDQREINAHAGELEACCWNFHAAVIERLQIRMIICFGNKTASSVCRRTGAQAYLGGFVEDNVRKWRTKAFSNGGGLIVVAATHPSRADWTTPAADPSSFIKGLLK